MHILVLLVMFAAPSASALTLSHTPQVIAHPCDGAVSPTSWTARAVARNTSSATVPWATMEIVSDAPGLTFTGPNPVRATSVRAGDSAAATWAATVDTTVGEYDYHITLQDPAGVMDCAGTATYSTDFEADDGGFVGHGEWLWDIPTATGVHPNSGTHCWGTGMHRSYADMQDDSLDSPSWSLAAGARACLSFALWADLENCCDYFELQIADDAGPWTLLIPPTYGSSGRWPRYQFDLSAYNGHAVRLRWHMHSDVSITQAGVFLDDVSLKQGPATDTIATVTQHYAIIVPPPTRALTISPAGPVSYCMGAPAPVHLSATFEGATGPVTYAWTPSAGLSATDVRNPLAQPETSTTYTCVATDDHCSGTATFRYNVVGLPLSVTSSPRVQCGTAPVALTLTVSGGTAPYTYLWSPTDGLSNAHVASPTASGFTGTRTYTVLVTDALGCQGTAEVVANIDSPRTFTVPDVSTNAGVPVTLDGSASGGTPPYTWTWTAPDSCTLPLGSYSEDFEASDGGYLGGGVPAITWMSPTSPAHSGTHCWGFGAVPLGAYSSQLISPFITLPESVAQCLSLWIRYIGSSIGEAHWSLDYTQDGGATWLRLVPTVRPGSDTGWLEHLVPLSPLAGSTVRFKLTAAGVSEGRDEFYVDDIAIHSGSPPTLSCLDCPNPTVTTGGTVTLSYSAADAYGCASSGTVTVHVGGPLSASLPETLDLCAGGNVTLPLSVSGGTSPYTYLWTPATGLSAIDVARPTASPSTTTDYAVQVTDATGATAFATTHVGVYAPLTVTTTGGTICAGGNVGIVAMVTGEEPFYRCSWTPAAGLSATNVVNPVASPASTTTYTVTVTRIGGSCQTRATATVTVVANPLVTVSGSDSLFCDGHGTDLLTTTVTGGSAPLRYAWSPLGGLSAPDVSDPVASPSMTTTYSVVVTDANGCRGTATTTVSVDRPLVVSASGGELTLPAGTHISVGVGGGTPSYSYDWTPAHGLGDPHSPMPFATPETTTTYTVTVTDMYGCTASDTAIVTVTTGIADASRPTASRETLRARFAGPTLYVSSDAPTTVCDVLGRTLAELPSGAHHLDASTWPRGIYLVREGEVTVRALKP